MTKTEVLKELKSYSNENNKKTLLKHGAKEPFYGVKVQDLKKIQKKIKKDHNLALELYSTGNSDAMYLAGFIADEKIITKETLNIWVNEAYWYYISEYTVPWIAAESEYGFEIGLEWIDSMEEERVAAGWATLAYLATIKQDDELDIAEYKKLLVRVEKNIANAQNRVRYVMNGFVIGIGGSISELNELATEVAKNIGKIEVDLGGTACKVPLATDYIKKVIDSGKLGNKRKKSARK